MKLAKTVHTADKRERSTHQKKYTVDRRSFILRHNGVGDVMNSKITGLIFKIF